MDDSFLGGGELGIDDWVGSDTFGELMVDALMPRACSEMSQASTVRVSPDPTFVIAAFCTFNGLLVHLNYPVAENGWVYRVDQGGHATHRWDLAGEVSIVAKHSTCAKSMRSKLRPCRNCEHKKWRLRCLDTCNTFFVFALHEVDAALRALVPLVLNTPDISDEDVQLYSAFAPKLNRKRQAPYVDPDRARKMMHQERNLRFSLLEGGTGLVATPYVRPRVATDDLFQLLMDADVGDRDSAGEHDISPATAAGRAEVLRADDAQPASSGAHTAPPGPQRPGGVPMQPAFPHAPRSALQVSEGASLVWCAPVASLQPTPTAPRAAPVMPTMLSSPTRNRNTTLAIYDSILETLVGFGADHTVTMSAAFLADLSSRSHRNLHGIAETHDSELLTYLYGKLGIRHDPVLVVKTTLLRLWANLAAGACRDVCAHIGFLSMHATKTFDDLRTSPLMPCVLAKREIHVHPSFELAASACLPGTRPVACVYYSPHAACRVYAATLLPLGF